MGEYGDKEEEEEGRSRTLRRRRLQAGGIGDRSTSRASASSNAERPIYHAHIGRAVVRSAAQSSRQPRWIYLGRGIIVSTAAAAAFFLVLVAAPASFQPATSTGWPSLENGGGQK